MRHALRRLALALVILPFAVSSASGQESERPFGLKKRVPWTTSRVVGTPEPPPPYTVERAFPKLKFKEPVYIAQEPGTERFLVGERSGKIFAFTKNTPDTESRELFLDIGRELYSFSFHPGYEQNGFVFTFSPRDPKDQAKVKLSRVARYQATRDKPRRCSPDSEKVIVEWPAGGHNGGEAIIGPDGYLYVSTGDSTSGSDVKNTGQGVDDLLSVIMRLDVDHPDKGKPYSIPKDNPFVNRPGARPEIWAFGFRNPWRMSFDAKTGGLWVGDVGQDLWEMIWLVQRGGNYGWSVQEGSHPFHPNKPIGPGPILPPVVEHHHTECRSITGGYAYYGEKFPELDGVYVYGDYEYGMIWGVRAENGKAVWNEMLADTALRIASFGLSRDGDILLLDHPSGEVYKLAKAPKSEATGKFPRKLSETGLFSSVADHELAPGVIPYSVNAPQWLDGATAERFMALPGDSKIQFVERSGNASTWGFADGTVNLQTISLNLKKDDPRSKRRIETRLIVKQQNHWLGYSYLWNEQQTDAELVERRGRDIRFKVSDPAAPNGHRQQVWRVPSRNECMFCHSRAAAFVLGIRTVQMNRDHDYSGVRDNQLRAFDHIGLFKNPLKKSPSAYAALRDPYDETAPVAPRARAYMHVNCSVCHVADGGGNAKIQLQYTQSLENSKLTEPPLHGSFGLSDARIISPGDPFASVLYYRLAKWGRGRMPHIGSNTHDEAGLELMHDWIASLDGDRPPSPSESETAVDDRLPFAEVSQAIRSVASADEGVQTKQIMKQLSNTRRAFMLARWASRNQDESSATKRLRERVVAQGAAHTDPNVRDLFERFLPPNQRTQRLGNDINLADILDLEGSAARGRTFFLTSKSSQCVNCHRVGDQGGGLGPDLSGIGAKYKAEEILESLIHPSRKIEPKFQTQLLITEQGRSYSGVLVRRNDKEVVLNSLQDGKSVEVRVAAADVDELTPQKTSLMPAGLLRDLTAQQAADLLAFLRSLRKPPSP